MSPESLSRKEQAMSRSTAEIKKLKNGGFSLVELIIVVSIIAIASVPLMKALGMASKTNAKAQSMQNATSLGESVMEKMKSSTIDELKADPDWNFTDNGTYYQLTSKTAINATQGESFDVTVRIDKGTYSGNVTPVADKKANVKSANTLKMPSIADIDSLSQAVLSAKEFNKYDTEAQNYFNQKLAKYPTETATIATKTIDIVKTNAIGAGSSFGVTVKATITYTDTSSNKYVRDLYTGTFIAQQNDDLTFKHFDSNIYIFYKQGCIPETINITDTSAVPIPPGKVSTDSHKVYYIRQVLGDTTGPLAVNFNGTSTFKYANVDALDADGIKDYGNIRFITNLDPSDISKEGHLYTEEARTRVYEIKVSLYKGSDLITELDSTRSASDEITPTPTPP